MSIPVKVASPFGVSTSFCLYRIGAQRDIYFVRPVYGLGSSGRVSVSTSGLIGKLSRGVTVGLPYTRGLSGLSCFGFGGGILGLGLRSIRTRGRRDHRCRGRLRDSTRTAKRRGGWRYYRCRSLLMRGFWRLRLFLRIDSFRIRNIVFMFIRRWHWHILG
jgi:hypothetical protein